MESEAKPTRPPPRALPTLFGRFTAITSQHAHLGVILRRLREMCGTLMPGHGGLRPELRPDLLFSELATDLSYHFAIEEGDDYFGTLIDERPSLLPAINQLRREHVSLRRTVGHLRDVALDERRWAELVTPTLSLLESLRIHELKETDLMQEFLLRDEGTSED